MRIGFYRQEWELQLGVNVIWDVFAPPNAPFAPEVQQAVDCLLAHGWTEQPIS